MKTILTFSFLEYVIPLLIFCVILCVIGYYVRVRLKNRAEIKIRQEVKSLEADIAKPNPENELRNEKKQEIYADLINFWGNPVFKPVDDLQNATKNMVLLKQRIKAVELIAGKEVKSILSEYKVDCQAPTDLSRLENAMKKEF